MRQAADSSLSVINCWRQSRYFSGKTNLLGPVHTNLVVVAAAPNEANQGASDEVW